MPTKNEPNRCVMGRIMRQRHHHKKDFYVSDFGGSWDKAWAAADRWEKAMAKILPSRLSAKGMMTKRNHSGVVGVNLSQQINHRPHKTYRYWRWVARWPGCPLNGGLGWSTNQWGDEDAFVLAFISRREESTNRPKIIEEFKSIRGTEEHRDILSLKKQIPPEADRDRSSPSRGRPSHPTGRTDRVSGESAASEQG